MSSNDCVLIPASEKQLECIRRELGEIGNKMDVYVKNFKDWLACEQHLPKDVDITMIQNYIRHTKFDLAKAKQKFEKYLVAKARYPSFFDRNFLEEHFDRNLLHKCSFILPQLTHQGYRIFVMMIPSPNIDQFEPELSNRFTLMLCDCLIHQDVNAGVVFIFDLRYLKMEHITKTPLRMFIEFIRIATIILPTRIREIHIFNMNPTAKKLLNICKSLLSNKLKQRLFVYKSCEIQGYLTPDVLPIALGGTFSKSIDDVSSRWRLCIEQNRSWIEKIDCVRLQGEVPKEFKSFEHELGVDGCFRKLEID